MAIRRQSSGFTIVELLIVIVVIGILAAITIIAYSGIQTKARDTQRKTDLAQIGKSLHLYNTDNGDLSLQLAHVPQVTTALAADGITTITIQPAHGNLSAAA